LAIVQSLQYPMMPFPVKNVAMLAKLNEPS
jgi:hypothetical protein